ncbi:MAG: hypothetical protein ACR2OW_15295 [Methyloligellaceae bacterium]
MDKAIFQDLVLMRILCVQSDGCYSNEIAKDMLCFASAETRAQEVSELLEAALEQLINSGAVFRTKGDVLKITEQGEKRALSFLRVRSISNLHWEEIKSLHIVARFLRIKSRSLAALEPLKTGDGLRASILKVYYNLPLKAHIPSLSQIRNALAVKSMNSVFMDNLPGGLSDGTVVSEDMALMLASRNLKRPREIGSTAQLLAILAAEAVDASDTEANSLRVAIYRKFAQGKSPSNETIPTAIRTQSVSDGFDLESFADVVSNLAKLKAEGWDGNRRAYISHVWQEIQNRTVGQQLNEREFKTRLAEAHRAGHLSLAIADLRDKSNISDIQDSVTRYKNTEWHLIRVED